MIPTPDKIINVCVNNVHVALLHLDRFRLSVWLVCRRRDEWRCGPRLDGDHEPTTMMMVVMIGLLNWALGFWYANLILKF